MLWRKQFFTILMEGADVQAHVQEYMHDSPPLTHTPPHMQQPGEKQAS